MSETPSVYQGMISRRSRRLRTVGVLLLIAILGMSLYGFAVLMPGINHALPALSATAGIHGPPSGIAQNGVSLTPAVRSARIVADAHTRKRILTQVIFVYAYWSVCTALILALFVVAWLDMREVSRHYVNARRAMWTDATDRLRRDGSQK